MRKSFVKILLVVACVATPAVTVRATGGFAPDRWLDNGGRAADMSPEFYWELELKRMAREFKPKEKRVEVPEPEDNAGNADDHRTETRDSFTAKMDVADFDDAIKTGRIKPPDPEKARKDHEAQRTLLNLQDDASAKAGLGDQFPSEFADYHRGALAFRHGAAADARAAWEGLLKRPAEERHYRSVWAAFMLGKLALEANDPIAVKWFRQARELAAKGFADSLGLAADSYGWEAKCELEQQHYEAAAKLYLTQLALGDESAIVSLKAVIADRPTVPGTLNFGDAPDENAANDQARDSEKGPSPAVQKRLDECARSPILRRLETAHVLATETQAEIWMTGDYGQGQEAGPSARCISWLNTLEKAGLKKIDDADHLGWVAYTAGRYKEAARWLAMAKPDSPTALWLKAKLERREGHYAQAAVLMATALKGIEDDTPEFGDTNFTYGERGYSPDQSAAGDLAGLHLTRGEFVDAMDAFLRGGLWSDAAFVGDRILTVNELKKYVETNYPKAAAPPKDQEAGGASDDASRMRWMLARRLVRLGQFDEAIPYFQPKERAILKRYTTAMKKGEDSKLSKLERARELYTAAWIARHNGMEIMGTETEPDGFENEGSFPPGHLDTERTEGVRVTMEYDDKKQEEVPKKKPAKFSIQPTADEKRRLVGNSPHPTRRYHYRWVAADLAWRAAALMTDNTEELADVLNTGGSWIKDHDDKGADKFVQAMDRRCAHTEIGKAESVRHWFVDQSGPWSDAMQSQDAANSPENGKPQ
jgi:hypothetical protein